jgi:hypothetical protein
VNLRKDHYRTPLCLPLTRYRGRSSAVAVDTNRWRSETSGSQYPGLHGRDDAPAVPFDLGPAWEVLSNAFRSDGASVAKTKSFGVGYLTQQAKPSNAALLR